MPRSTTPAVRPRSRPTADVRHGSSSSSSASWQRKALVGAVAAAVVLLGVGVVRAVRGTGLGDRHLSSVFGHVHGLGVDPADAALYADTHYGLFPRSGRMAAAAGWRTASRTIWDSPSKFCAGLARDLIR
jgi:hypothetical protein